MTQPSINDKPAWGSVEGYLEMLREKEAAGWDLYPYAFGIATATASNPTHSAEERIRRITNLDAAVQAIKAERDPARVHFLEPGSDGDDDDRMACGQRFGDAVKSGSFTGVEADVTCRACRKSAMLDAPAPTVPVCLHETGGGSALRRRCGREIWRNESTGRWHHVLGDLGIGHEAMPPAAPVSEAS